MPTKQKVSRLILQLTRDTVDKKLDWEMSEAPKTLTRGNNDLITDYLEAEYKGQILVLIKWRVQSYDEERDSLYWVSDLAIVILDSEQRILWEHRENSSALANLFQVARESAANVDSILDSLLG